MKVLLFANTDWYLYNFIRDLGLAMKRCGYDVLMVSPPGRYGERLKRMGLDWRPAPLDRAGLNPARELRLIWWLSRLIRKEKVNLAHGFTIKCAIYASLAARFSARCARVTTISGLGSVYTADSLKARGLRHLISFLMKVTLGGSDARLLVLNRDDFREFSQRGIVHEEHIRLIPGAGVDCTLFSPVPREASNEFFSVLFPARLLKDKGLVEFIGAARLLLSEGMAIRFIVAGSPDHGNPTAVPENLVNRWVDKGIIDWLGHVDDIPELLSRMDLVVLPSYREGLPTSLIEAGACGLPVVATDVPGCRDAVEHNVTGLLVPPRDSCALAEAIKELYGDPKLRFRFGEAGRRKACEEFETSIVIRKMISVYNEFLPVDSRTTV